MSEAGAVVEALENHEWLRGRFVQWLLEGAPASVLDVGCGSGWLLEECRRAGIPCRGLDAAGPRLGGLREEGLDVLAGTAHALPFADGELDWVTLRHVPHHLEEPARALGEALRVARTGVLVAEPCFDRALPSQQGALAADRWEKRQHRRVGSYHAEDLDLGALLGLLEPGYEERYDIVVHHDLRLRSRSLADYERDATELVAELPANHPEREALHALLDELGRLGLSYNGSLCVVLRHRR